MSGRSHGGPLHWKGSVAEVSDSETIKEFCTNFARVRFYLGFIEHTFGFKTTSFNLRKSNRYGWQLMAKIFPQNQKMLFLKVVWWTGGFNGALAPICFEALSICLKHNKHLDVLNWLHVFSIRRPEKISFSKVALKVHWHWGRTGGGPRRWTHGSRVCSGVQATQVWSAAVALQTALL